MDFQKKKMRVAVLMGGPSSEHEVSLRSGRKVLENLDAEVYESFPIVIGKQGEWPFPLKELKEKCDVAFIAMHGTYGEDGGIQSVLEEIKIPYTGSGSLTSALAMNKFLSTQLFKRHGFSVPLSFHISKTDWEKGKRDSFNTI